MQTPKCSGWRERTADWDSSFLPSIQPYCSSQHVQSVLFYVYPASPPPYPTGLACTSNTPSRVSTVWTWSSKLLQWPQFSWYILQKQAPNLGQNRSKFSLFEVDKRMYMNKATGCSSGQTQILYYRKMFLPKNILVKDCSWQSSTIFIPQSIAPVQMAHHSEVLLHPLKSSCPLLREACLSF